MDELEPVAAPPEEFRHVDLVDGIDLNKLRDGSEGEMFEIDPTSVERDEEEDRYFNREELFKQLNYECLDTGGGTDSESGDEDSPLHSPFERMSKRMTAITEDGGVKKELLHEGTGDVVPINAVCTVHYNAWLDMSDEPFDSSRLRGRKHITKLGSGDGIAGFAVAVSTMRRSELSRFMLEPEYAYGRMGCPPRIPADATVMFEIELISFLDQSDLDHVNEMDEGERASASFDKILAAARNLKVEGTEAFRSKNITKASSRYSRALRMLENANLKDEEDEEKMKSEAHSLYLNLSICDLKQKRSGRAAKYAKKALEQEPGNVKAIYRLAKAHHQLGEHEQARTQYLKAIRLKPGSDEIRQQLEVLDRDVRALSGERMNLERKMMNVKVADEKKAKPEAELSQMMRVLKERLEKFSQSDDATEIALPNNLTADELESAKKISQSLGLALVVDRDGDRAVRSVRVSKVAK